MGLLCTAVGAYLVACEVIGLATDGVLVSHWTGRRGATRDLWWVALGVHFLLERRRLRRGGVHRGENVAAG